jgi:hypothetical protein
MLVRMQTSSGGGTPKLEYDGYEAYIGTTGQSSFTIVGDHDFVEVVTSGVQATSYATYNGVNYYWKRQISSSESGSAAGSTLIPNVKDGTSITFPGAFAKVGFYGLSYTK